MWKFRKKRKPAAEVTLIERKPQMTDLDYYFSPSGKVYQLITSIVHRCILSFHFLQYILNS